MSNVRLAGVDLHYTDSGEQELPCVIIMHGWGCNISTVASIEAIFKGKMRVINIDLPGHGQSTEPPFAWGVEEFSAMLEELVRHLDLDSPSLIGHSFGGRVSIVYASRNAVSRVMLVDSAGIKPKRPFKWYFKVYSFKVAKKLLPLALGKKRGGMLVDKWRGKSGSADYRNSSPMMRAVMSRCVNQDLRKYMPKIKVPVLLVWGEMDTATPLGDAKIMEELIPDAGLAVFPGCGHYSFLDNPLGFRAVTQEFFKKDLGIEVV